MGKHISGTLSDMRAPGHSESHRVAPIYKVSGERFGNRW